jgi:hypothetical protein
MFTPRRLPNLVPDTYVKVSLIQIPQTTHVSRQNSELIGKIKTPHTITSNFMLLARPITPRLDKTKGQRVRKVKGQGLPMSEDNRQGLRSL